MFHLSLPRSLHDKVDFNNVGFSLTKMVQDEIKFRGHPNVLSLHRRTLEVTKDDSLTLRGDCIIGVGADKACADLDERLKKGVSRSDSMVKVEIIVGGESYSIQGYGDSRLTLTNKHDVVIRKTRFVCPRTLSVACDRASSDIPRNMVKLLQHSETTALLRVSVE